VSGDIARSSKSSNSSSETIPVCRKKKERAFKHLGKNKASFERKKKQVSN
jgi:hypothetical protein